MNELVNQIVQKTGIPTDKAQQVLSVMAGFVKQKFPAIGAQIDSVLGTGATHGNNTGATGAADNPLGDLGGKFGF